MRILFIAPFPPPISGHSIAAQVFLDDLQNNHEVLTVNLNPERKYRYSKSINKIWDTFRRIRKVSKYKSKSDVIYLTISESLGGNFKDLLIYLVCFGKLKKTYIHLHGGSIRKLLFDKYKLLFKINRFFISKLAGVIVLGDSHKNAFKGMIDKEKIFVVPNFAEDDLFIDNQKIEEKYSKLEKIRLLFLSNLLPKKGYNELIEAYLSLSKEEQVKVSLDFAGRFDSDELRKEFITKISDCPEVSYHGIVSGEKKIELLKQSHALCLPTSYLEGQPLAILEAYASGCAVVTTENGGIVDIFEDNKNGYSILAPNVNEVKVSLQKVISNLHKLRNIGINNKETAWTNYRKQTYNNALRRILEQKV